jgi:trans-aconitate methyltransferase
MRKRLTPEESLQAAQKYVAYSKYRQVQELVGAYPNAEQKAYLRKYREYLGEQYPGFALATFDPNRIKNNIKELELAVQEPSLAENNVAKAAKLYLDARSSVMVEAGNRGLTSIDRSKNASDLRGYLRQYADVLKKEYPEFARLYDRILIEEVDE